MLVQFLSFLQLKCQINNECLEASNFDVSFVGFFWISSERFVELSTIHAILVSYQ